VGKIYHKDTGEKHRAQRKGHRNSNHESRKKELYGRTPEHSEGMRTKSIRVFEVPPRGKTRVPGKFDKKLGG